MVSWIPEITISQDYTWWDDLITKTETGELSVSGKCCRVTNVHEKAFSPFNSSSFQLISIQFNKHILSVNPAQGAMLGVGHNFIAYNGTMYSHGFFEKFYFLEQI